MADESMENDSGSAGHDSLSRLKRTACGLCRKRKLKCDGTRPMCATCLRLGHDCVYEEARKKSGPKRGYVKALEARLAQVETQLKSKDLDSSIMMLDEDGLLPDGTSGLADLSNDYAGTQYPSVNYTMPGADLKATAPNFGPSPPLVNPSWNAGDANDPYSAPWDLLPTGLEEPLPSQQIIGELTDIYFSKIHSYVPILHRARFLMTMALPPNLQPTVALRYAMWTLAAETSDRHASTSDIFYRRARKYLQLDEMRGFGESMVSVAHCQSWVLISLYEFKNMYFPRAWMSCGRAVRLAQMLGLHRVDGGSSECKETLAPPKDWIEKEERRRTFWMTFWEDRCASIGTGWPMSVEEQDIHTNLPASDESFQSGRPAPTQSLLEALHTAGSDLSGFAGAILLAAMLGRNLEHMHRISVDDNEGDLNGKYWTRHRDIDNILLNLTMGMPEALRIPQGLPDPNVIFMNMCVHTSVICLHQSAMSRADKHSLTGSISAESKMRCITAALEIASIMRAIAHLDLATMNPFMSFCLYVAARVFIQYLRARRNDARFQSSLSFVLSAMNAMKKKNALNEAFLAQLDVEMEACNLPRPAFSVTLGGVFQQANQNLSHVKRNPQGPDPALSAGPRVVAGDSCGVTGFVNNANSLEPDPVSATSSGSRNAATYESRLPPPGPFEWSMPDGSLGLSPANTTQGSMNESHSTNTPELSRHASLNQPADTTPMLGRHDSQGMGGAAGLPGASASYQFRGGNNHEDTSSNLSATQLLHGVPGPPTYNWADESVVTTQPEYVMQYPSPTIFSAQKQTQANAATLAEMDMAFDLPTQSDFTNPLGTTTNIEAYIDGDTSGMTFTQTTVPIRGAQSNTDTSNSAQTPLSWDMANGSGMTPNFNDMTGTNDWDNFMEDLADWDPTNVGGAARP